MQIVPRIYQKLSITKALKALKLTGKALVVMATGLGKTITSALIVKDSKAKRTLFLVHNNFILDHAIDDFRLIFNEKKVKMRIYNGLFREGVEDADIVFASWQTMSKKLRQWRRQHFDLVVVDEAHHTEAEKWKPVVRYFIAKKLGITATPDREDEADIRETFGDEVVNIPLEEAIARGWLPSVEYHIVTDESLDDHALQVLALEIRQGKKRFTMAEVNRRIFIKKRDEEIAKIINGYKEKALVFCGDITHANSVAGFLENARPFHSKTQKSSRKTAERNRETLGMLSTGEITRVTAVNAFNEGVNVPSIGLIGFCRVIGVLNIFRQQLGRGLRPGKDKLIALDFVGNLERIQLVIEMMNRVADLHEKFVSEEEREREGYVRKRFEVSGKGFQFIFSDKTVDLIEILRHCKRELYSTWQEASAAAIKLGFCDSKAYRKGYSIDPCLPSAPDACYPDFPGWHVFLKRYYGTWREASEAAATLGIKSQLDYAKKYSKDPKLPSSPAVYYSLPGWDYFFGKKKKEFYPTLKEASDAAKKLKIKGQLDYKSKYKLDPRLPSGPSSFYSDFPGWRVFLGLQSRHYGTWEEAGRAAVKVGIKSSKEYVQKGGYKKDPMLPSDPRLTYKETWIGWDAFFQRV